MFASIVFLLSLLANGACAEKKFKWTLKITVTNIAYQQPLSPFFVLTHSEKAAPVFKLGMPPSGPLATLAEMGDPSELVDFYRSDEGKKGVHWAKSAGAAPIFAGESLSFNVVVSWSRPLVSFVSMAVNTNDAFVGVDGMRFYGGETVTSPGYDAGSEANDESAMNVPGPCCGGTGRNTTGAEGVVHIHRGIHGVGDLAPEVYDWRNPMLLIETKVVKIWY